MATIKKRNNKYCVIYNYVTPDGQKKQKWETYHTKEEAKKRKTEIEYKSNLGPFVVPDCKTLKELMEEKEKTEQKLEEKMDRWVYLNDLYEQIQK